MSVNTRTEFINITKSSDLTIYGHVDAVFDQIWGGFFHKIYVMTGNESKIYSAKE
jgi:hypothetical protein